MTNAVSELTETGAKYVLVLAIPYCIWDILIILFFTGVIITFKSTILRIASVLMIITCIVGILGYTIFTMDPIVAAPTFKGTFHVVYGTTLGILLPLVSMILFGIGLWKNSRKTSIYTFITIIFILLFGILISLATPLFLVHKFHYFGLLEISTMLIAYQWFIGLSILFLRISRNEKMNSKHI